MDLVILFFKNVLDLTSAMAVYILVGLLIAGVLKEIIPPDYISRKLGKKSFGSVLKASLLGIPLPLCSCSVVPFAVSLKKEGASKGAVQSFLISTPITGVDSILATYGTFGLAFVVYKVVTSFVMAIVAGIVQNVSDKYEPQEVENLQSKVVQKKEEVKTCACEEQKEEISSCGCTDKKEEKESTCCCSGEEKKDEDKEEGCGCSNGGSNKKGFDIAGIFHYAFGILFKDMAKSLFFGILIGALFTTFLPPELAKGLFSHTYLTYLLMIVISVPLFVCATSSIPIAVSLLLNGMSFGAAFIFLSAGPATSTVTMAVIYKTLGKKALGIYLGVIIILSLVFGYIFDNFLPHDALRAGVVKSEHAGIFTEFFAVVMLVMLVYYLVQGFLEKRFGIKPKKKKKKSGSCCG